jgi:hypothetical protein
LLEEYYKILRSGSAEATFRAMGRVRLLELITPEMALPPESVWDSLARLDRYRLRFPSAPPELTNSLLIGALLEPLGRLARPVTTRGHDPRSDRVSFGMLTIARRDLERLRQIADLAPRLLDPTLPPRLARSMPHRPAFADTLTWIEIHADAAEIVAGWKHAGHHRPPGPQDISGPAADHALHGRRRRRRRRRRRGRRPGPPPTGG